MAQYQDTLQAQIRLRKASEKLVRDTIAELKRVAEAICPEEVDKYRKTSPDGMAFLSPSEIAEMVIRAYFRKKVQFTPPPPRQPGENVGAAGVVGTGGTSPSPKPEPSPPPPSPQAQSKPAAQPMPPARPPWLSGELEPAPAEPATAYSDWPEWAQVWRKEKAFERQQDVVLALGDTGVATRKDLVDMLAGWWNISPSSGTFDRALKRVRAEHELAELVAVGQTDPPWKPSHLVRLTPRGREAYYLLRDREPVDSHATGLLARHKSPEHTVLNIEAARLLWQAGYEVDMFPPETDVDGKFCPDLVATLDGQTIYVECERDTSKDAAARARKWDIYYRATGGRFHIVTPTDKAMEVIVSEIKTWARDNGRTLELWAANLEHSSEVSEEIWRLEQKISKMGGFRPHSEVDLAP